MSESSSPCPPRPNRWGYWVWRLGMGAYYQDGTGWRMHCRWWHPLTWLLILGV
ncbi:MAG: hypothetical protein K6U87_14405 [Firmicutes bacterium]|nr:hypothetical protein [Bacillota bacterium]